MHTELAIKPLLLLLVVSLLAGLTQWQVCTARLPLTSTSPKCGVVWNVPSRKCVQLGFRLQLAKFGILGNDGDGGAWRGDVVNIFYERDLGLYPRIGDNGRWINGGLPQLADIAHHLDVLSHDLENAIPNRNFSGRLVIDWESWRPLLSRNWDAKDVYRKESIRLVRKAHPSWNKKKLLYVAEMEFNKAARNFMDQTLQQVMRLRPNAQAGFYLFPDCPEYPCSEAMQVDNNRLAWLFRRSSSLYPSAYLDSGVSPQLAAQFVRSVVAEASRVNNDKRPIDLYSQITYRGGAHFYSEADLNSSIGVAAESGAVQSVILWASSAKINPGFCAELRRYVLTVLGPFLLRLRGVAT